MVLPCHVRRRPARYSPQSTGSRAVRRGTTSAGSLPGLPGSRGPAECPGGEDPGNDRTAATRNAHLCIRNPAVADMALRFGPAAPGHPANGYRCKAHRHVNAGVSVQATGLEQGHPVRGGFAQPRRKHATGSSACDDDMAVSCGRHGSLSPESGDFLV